VLLVIYCISEENQANNHVCLLFKGKADLRQVMDDISDVRAFYDNAPQLEEARLDVQQLEFDITWRWLMQVLPEQGHILELGASTGRYTLPVAKRGLHVTAFDLSAKTIAISRSKAHQVGLESRIKYVTGDARDLTCLGNVEYDAALVMGPLYHLFSAPDRQVVLDQTYRHLKNGAPIVSSIIQRLGIMGFIMANSPEWILRPDEVDWMLREGRDSPEYPKGGFPGYGARPEELREMHEGAGFITECIAAVEPAIGAFDESYNRLQGKVHEAWLDLLFRISTEPSLLGTSRHLLYIGHKPGL
jgi:S-adenosylmethionine-dependent methyltransferase